MHIDPEFLRGAPIRRCSRAALHAQLGTVHPGQEILFGIRATRLATLPSAGVLFLTLAGQVLAVHDTPDPQQVDVVEFAGAGQTTWSRVEALYPGITPGSPALPRFRIAVEPTSPGFPPTFGLLDLLEMRVVEMGGDHLALLERQAWANRCPACYLGMVEHAVRSATVQELVRHLAHAEGVPSFAE